MRSQDNPIIQNNNKINNSGNNSCDNSQSNTLLNNSSTSSSNWSKVQALKQRKSELEKLLNEKNLLLQQIVKQEGQILRDYGNLETNFNLVDNGGNCTILRRKVGTSYKLPKNLINCKEEDDIEKLLIDKKIQQDICNAAFKLANDANISKSIRRSHKADYEAAQQKLVLIHQNINKLKKRQSGQFKSNSLPNSTMIITSTSTKNDQIGNVHLQSSSSTSSAAQQIYGSSDTIGSNKHCNNSTILKYGSYNCGQNNNIYHPTERRNSMKSIAAINLQQKNFDDCNIGSNIPLLLDKSNKGHCSEYDINRLVTAITDNNRSNSSNCFSPTCTSYFCANNNNNNSNNNTNHRHQGFTDGTYFGYIGGTTNSNNNTSNSNPTYKYITTNKVGNFVQTDDGTLIKLSPTGSNALFQNYNLFIVNGCSEDQRVGGVGGGLGDVLNDKNLYTQQCGSGGDSRKYCNNVDTISTSPSTIGTNYEQQHIGLGGYWRTLANNERVWCAIDNCSGNNMVYQQQHKPKKTNTTLASSLGNFDLIASKDESVDQISVSSMSSESNRRTKEKQWLETSLDGPMLRTKSTSTPETDASQQRNLSPVYNTNSLHGGHHHSHKHHKMGNRSKLSSQSMSNNSYRPNMTKLEDQTYLSHSTSVLNINSTPVDPQYNSRSLLAIISPSDQQHHHQQHQQYHQNQISPPGIVVIDHIQNPQTGIYIPSRQLSPSITNSPTFKIPARSPIISCNNKTSDIRIESPKNMTVIQQATFMPYKEITKPFEMSDFYKYSTKFRQKEAKQQQQQQTTSTTPILSVLADAT